MLVMIILKKEPDLKWIPAEKAEYLEEATKEVAIYKFGFPEYSMASSINRVKNTETLSRTALL